MADRVSRKLTVTACTEFRRGHGANGDWVMFTVKAVDERGAPVDAKLRTFKALPVGQEQVYEVEKHVHETYGETFTLYPPKRKTAERVEDLEARVAGLELAVGRLTSQLESGAGTC